MSRRAVGSPPSVVAVDIGGTKIDVALADAAGVLLDRLRVDTRADQGPDGVLGRVGDAVATLVRRARGEVRLEACAMVTPGIVLGDRVLLAPNLPGWERIAVADRLRELLQIESIRVSNDVSAGAVAELRSGALRGVDPGVYLSLGTGIRAALTVGSHVVDGAHGAAGEIAYTRTWLSPLLNAADDQAPLEEIASGKAIAARASSYLGVPVTAEAAFADRRPVARQAVHEALTALATAIGNLAVFVDPQRIVIGGGLAAQADTIVPVLTALLRQRVPFPPDVVPAQFTQDASLYGAIALAVESKRLAFMPAESDALGEETA